MIELFCNYCDETECDNLTKRFREKLPRKTSSIYHIFLGYVLSASDAANHVNLHGDNDPYTSVFLSELLRCDKEIREMFHKY